MGITPSHSFNLAPAPLYSPCKFCLFIFYVIVKNIFFFSRSDIITKQKELCQKIKKKEGKSEFSCFVSINL